MFRPLLPLIFLLTLTSCALGPDYERPELALPSTYRFENEKALSTADLKWFENFPDSKLRALLEIGLKENLDARIAARRIEQAEAALGVSRSEYFPHFSATFFGGREKNAGLQRASQTLGITRESYSGEIGAFWEIDLWGRIRRLNEASRAELLTTESARNGVLLSLTSQLARDYLELIELEIELGITKDTVASYQDSLGIFSARAKAGIGSALEVMRVQAALSQAQAVIPQLERAISQKENAISLLLGKAPGPIERTHEMIERSLPAQVPVGIPSELINRRPDIMQTEARLIAANARVGIAITKFLPTFSLTGLFGGVSGDLSEFSWNRNGVWQYAGSVVGPIFEGGKNIANYDLAVAEWEEAKLVYEQSVLSALREVADILIARETLVREVSSLTTQVDSLRESVKLAKERYGSGLASYYEVIEAQQALFPAEIALARNRINQYLVLVDLYRVLGGGWSVT